MTEHPNRANGKTLTGFERGVSLFELILGGAIVVGHNVFKIVPNEVPILAGLGLLSLFVRNGSLKPIGLTWPQSWTRTLVWAIATATLVQLNSEFVTDPLTKLIWHRPPNISEFNSLKGNLSDAAALLVLSWSFAAFGEEFGYRGYLLARAADIGGRSPVAYSLGLIVVSVLFGFGHYYQGPSGVLGTALDGFLIGAAYLLSGRNLWVAILAHGLTDTFGVVVLFLGLAD